MGEGSFGSVVLAAYRPDDELFARQLGSIKEQTHVDFECIITADGEADTVRDQVARIVGGDERFRVIGFDERLGFYHNFERGLQAISPRSSWVALSDQDDLWHPDKLERLLPELVSCALVSGQARVVRYPSGEVLRDSTARVGVPLEGFISNNQFTGSLMVFRRALLERALPFPVAPFALHDHWLAVCAAIDGGVRVVPDIVQDYVQHSANAIGEVSEEAGLELRHGWAQLRSFSRRYENSTSLLARMRTLYELFAGWSEALVDTASQRYPDRASQLSRSVALYGRERRVMRTMRNLRGAAQAGIVSREAWVIATASDLAGIASGARQRNRRLREDDPRPGSAGG